jgi:hypothetical protein
MNTSRLIDSLGGTGALATVLNENPSTISMWKQRGIPWKWRPTIAQMARERDLDVPDDFLSPSAA